MLNVPTYTGHEVRFVVVGLSIMTKGRQGAVVDGSSTTTAMACRRGSPSLWLADDGHLHMQMPPFWGLAGVSKVTLGLPDELILCLDQYHCIVLWSKL